MEAFENTQTINFPGKSHRIPKTDETDPKRYTGGNEIGVGIKNSGVLSSHKPVSFI